MRKFPTEPIRAIPIIMAPVIPEISHGMMGITAAYSMALYVIWLCITLVTAGLNVRHSQYQYSGQCMGDISIFFSAQCFSVEWCCWRNPANGSCCFECFHVTFLSNRYWIFTKTRSSDITYLFITKCPPQL